MIPSDTWRMRRFLSLFQSFHKTPWRLLQCCWFVLRLQEKICNFSRNKLRRRHFSRKVLKAETAFLLALFPSFWKTPLKLLLWSSFFKRLEEVLNNFCRNELPEGRNVLKAETTFFIYFVSKIFEKSLELTIVELFFKKLRAAVSVTVSEMNSTVGILLRTFWGKKNIFFCFKIGQNNFSYMCGS